MDHNKGRAGFGKWLRKARLAKGLSQRELSEAAGFHQTSGRISRYESGQSVPNDMAMWEILKALGLLSEWELWCNKLGIPEHVRDYRG